MLKNKLSNNIAYNVLNQFVSILVPFILAPYVARTLSPELIGDYTYALANSSYFVLIEALGFSLYGILTVSAKRDDKEEISEIFFEIMIAKILLMSICVFVYYLLFVAFSLKNKILCCIMILNIISTGIDTTWFLNALEEFKITTIRNIFVKLANISLVFLFVKSSSDFLAYALIMQLSNVVSYLVVIPSIKKRIVPTKISIREIINHTIKSMVYFVPGIVNTIFTSTDKTILGYYANNYEVGVYEQASKICTLCGSVISSVSYVILPRASYLNHNSQKVARDFINETIKYASFITVGVSFGIICISNEFISIYYGFGYEKSAILIKILACNVLLSVLINYLGQQCLISNSKQNQYNVSITIGAVLNILLNIIFVKQNQSIGVSIASVFSSLIVCLMILQYSKEIIKLKDLICMNRNYFISAIIMLIITSFIKIDNLLISLLLKTLLGGSIYLVVLFIIKDSVVVNLFNKIVPEFK